MIKGVEDYLNDYKIKSLLALPQPPDPAQVKALLELRPRVEKAAIKDAKLRTFITQDNQRDDLVAHVYDTTYGILRPGLDNLVVIDDSIVRGTTLKQSIIRILARLQPKKIVIVSSAPQIRYPDCYGIDMSRMGDFVAFRAAINLLKSSGREALIDQVYAQCKAQDGLPDEQIVNYVKQIYAPFTDEEISAEIACIVTPEDLEVPVEVIFQTIAGLHSHTPPPGRLVLQWQLPNAGRHAGGESCVYQLH